MTFFGFSRRTRRFSSSLDSTADIAATAASRQKASLELKRREIRLDRLKNKIISLPADSPAVAALQAELAVLNDIYELEKEFFRHQRPDRSNKRSENSQ